jgi:hypothetical protein
MKVSAKEVRQRYQIAQEPQIFILIGSNDGSAFLIQQRRKGLSRPIQRLSWIAKANRDIRQMISKKMPHEMKQFTIYFKLKE